MKILNKKMPSAKEGKNPSGSTPTLVRPTSLPSLYLSLHFSIPQFACFPTETRPAVLAPRLYSGGDVKLWKELLYPHVASPLYPLGSSALDQWARLLYRQVIPLFLHLSLSYSFGHPHKLRQLLHYSSRSLRCHHPRVIILCAISSTSEF